MDLYLQTVPKGDPQAADPNTNIEFKEWPVEDLDPDVQPGDYASRLGFHFIWTSRCLKGKELIPLQREGDDLADAVVRALNLQPREDGLAKLLAYHKNNNIKEVEEFYDQMTKVPEWVDWAQIKRGQDLFWQNSPTMLLSLLHFSLVGSFAVPQMVSVLACTGMQIYYCGAFVYSVGVNLVQIYLFYFILRVSSRQEQDRHSPSPL